MFLELNAFFTYMYINFIQKFYLYTSFWLVWHLSILVEVEYCFNLDIFNIRFFYLMKWANDEIF